MHTEDEENKMFHSWECISLFRKNGTTFDIVIKDRTKMMVLLHFLHRKVYSKIDPEAKLFSSYKWHAIKMKLSFETWVRKIKLPDLFKHAIFKTLV